jgi:hypothetical protein
VTLSAFVHPYGGECKRRYAEWSRTRST